ncbi:MAG: siderophore-interacting protein [Pantoea sp. Pent]|nr:siderophore-interacting protein [Pantoea sp. Pent]
MPNPTHHRAPQRVRNELRFRHITVASKTRVADAFWRIVFSGSDLAGFLSPSFDDHIKVFFPDTPGGALALDFYIHDGGVASSWASAAQPGDRIAMGGPRGSCVVPVDYACQIYVCDETGLPAFKHRYQEMQAQQIHLLACVDEPIGRAYLGDLPDVTVSWLGSGRMQAEALTPLLDPIVLPADDYFIWLTGEGAAVKQLSDYFTQQRAAHSDLVRAVAYWHQK